MDAPSLSDPTPSDAPPFRIPRAGIVSFFVVVAIVSGVLPLVKEKPGDEAVYARGADRMIAGERIYRPEEDSAFTYPPFCGLYFVPLAPLPEPVRRGCWYFISLTLLGTAVYLVSRQIWPMVSAGIRRGGAPLWAYCTIVTLLSARFLISPIENQANDPIVFAFVAAAVFAWGAGRDKTAGCCAGMGAATKATPLLFLPVLLWQRRFAAGGVLVLAIAVATFLPDLLLPQANGELWAWSWYESFISQVGAGRVASADGAWRSWNILNQSLAGTLYRLSTPVDLSTESIFDVSLWNAAGTRLKLLTLGSQLAVVGFLAWITRPSLSVGITNEERSFRRLGEGGAVVCAMLLLSPMSSKQHFCVLFVPIAWCAAYVLYRRRDLFAMAALLFVFCTTTVMVKDIVGRTLGNVLLGYGSLTFSTLACFAATGVLLLRDGRALRNTKTDSDSSERASAPSPHTAEELAA